jgi:hypothetical protein
VTEYKGVAKILGASKRAKSFVGTYLYLGMLVKEIEF